MGGGGVMKAVANYVGIGLAAGGRLRGVFSTPPAENTVSAAACNASPSRPVAAIFSSHDGEVSRDPLPRVVFGGVPTMEEAKEATSELKDVLEKAYLKSPNSTSSEGSFIVGQEPSLPILLSNSEVTQAMACLTSETTVSNHAVHAFKFLSENPAVQSVVASIASDPNVYNAVMENEEIIKYIQAHKIAAASPEMDLNANKSAADGNFQEQDPNDAQKPFKDSQPGTLGTGFKSFLEKAKRRVVDMSSNLSSFVQNRFGGSVAEKKSVDADGSEGMAFKDTTDLGSYFLALAVFVIMLIVLKRV